LLTMTEKQLLQGSKLAPNKRIQADTLLLAPLAECAADAGRYVAKISLTFHYLSLK